MTDARLTQESLEQWVNVNAQARATTVLVEMWGPGGTTRAVATLVCVEMWFTVAPPARGGPMVTMIW